jgi:hypothetical protein
MTLRSRIFAPGSAVKNSFYLICLLAIVVGLYFRLRYVFAPLPRSTAGQPNAEETLFTFTQRSPLSAPSELARRLRLKASDVTPDYDLAKRPFRAYVPRENPDQPYGLFVYLNYKDSDSVATPWEPTLDKTHTIFITPECHYGLNSNFPDSVPMWQMLGLAFDAVDNLKQKYPINPDRIYLMTVNDGAMQMVLAGSDVFTGLVVCYGLAYFEPVNLPDYSWHFDASFLKPPAQLLKTAMQRPLILISDDFKTRDNYGRLLVEQMKAEGFQHILPMELSTSSDVHYPNFAPKWFSETALPFLDRLQSGLP